MPNYTCPSCGQTFHTSNEPDGPCLICGHFLKEYVAPKLFHPGTLDLVAVARAQRWMLFTTPVAIAGVLLFAYGPAMVFLGINLSPLCWLPTLILAGAVGYLVSALDSPNDRSMLSAVAMFVPVINIMILIGLNARATGVLKKAGVPIGILGASRGSVEAAMDPNICRSCGYDLTGNVSGRCPECGTNVHVKVNER